MRLKIFLLSLPFFLLLYSTYFFFYRSSLVYCKSEIRSISCDEKALEKYYKEFFKKNTNIYLLNGFQSRKVPIKNIKKITVYLQINNNENKIVIGENGGFDFVVREKNGELLITVNPDAQLISYFQKIKNNRELNSLLTAAFSSMLEEKNVLNLINLPTQLEAVSKYNQLMKESFVLKIH